MGDRAVGPIELDFPTVLPEPCGDLRERVADALETTAITAVLKSRFDVLVSTYCQRLFRFNLFCQRSVRKHMHCGNVVGQSSSFVHGCP